MNLDQILHDTDFENYNRRSDKKKKQSGNGFDDLGIAPNLLKAINKLNFINPTPIQKESIPIGLKGDDIIALARTGSGKTVAFGIPMLQRLSNSKHGTGLVLVPTRELAIQVEESLQPLSRSVNIRSIVLIGGASMTMQRVALKKNPRIIIATPGRLMDHLERRTVNLSNVEVFILDEADRMLDMGFVPDIKKIMKSIPNKRQTMLFSATMPKEIEAIAKKLMENPTRIETDRSGQTPSEVSHELFFINNPSKKRLLAVQIKQCTGPVLVFTRTKRMATKLTSNITKMGFTAAEIHSDRSQGQRRNALEGFKRGRYQILIATDIAARGIDVTGIEMVVNYDMPANSEDYVHRIGRTGRAGKKGHAVSFANTTQKSTIKDIERFMKTKLAVSTLPVLPSEKSLLEEGDKINSRLRYSQDERPSRRRNSNDRSSNRRDSNNAEKFAKRRINSKRDDFRSKDSDQKESKKRYSKRKDSNQTESKYKDFKRKDSNQTESKYKDFKRKDSKKQESKDSKQKKSKSSDYNKKSSNKDNPFWSQFKKKRPGKKKSVGQGTKRKKGSKRK